MTKVLVVLVVVGLVALLSMKMHILPMEGKDTDMNNMHMKEMEMPQSNAQEILDLYPVDLSGIASHPHNMFEVDPEGAPTLTIEVTQDPMGAGDFAVQLITENFRFAPESVSSAHVPGEGHGHIYVNDIKIGRLYADWYHLPTLKPGTHTILVTLSTNDHKEYAVNGVSVADSVTITVPEDTSMHMMS